MRSRVLAFFDPNRSMALFVVGTSALTVVITAAYDTIKETAGISGAWLLAGFLLLVALSTIIYQTIRRATAGRVGIREEMKPRPREGLVLLISPHKGTSSAAIEYHLPRLRTCWFIGSRESLAIAQELYEEYGGRVPDIRWGSSYLVDPDQVGNTYDVVLRVFDEEARGTGLGPGSMIADITGGQKPMTAGMALACLARTIDMQYMKGARDEQGEVDRTVPPEPVKIDTRLVPGPVVSQP